MSDEGPLIRQLFLLFVLVLISFLFSCFEIAVISVNQTKLDKLASGGDKRAKRLIKLTSLPSKFLATIQVGNTLAGFMASAFAAKNIAARLTNRLVALDTPISAASFSPDKT